MSARQVAGAILLAIGVIVTAGGTAGAAGLLGAAAEDGSASVPPPNESAGVSPLGSPSPAPSPSPSPSLAPSPSPSPDPDGLIQAFTDDLVAAIRVGNVIVMLPRLHPAVIDRYGDDACQENLSTRAADPGYAIAIKEVRAPAPWDYVTDEKTTSIPDAWTIVADVTALDATGAREVTGERELHVAPVAGEVGWFTDCGTPLP